MKSSNNSPVNPTTKWEKKTVKIQGDTAASRKKELSKVQPQMQNSGWDLIEFHDDGVDSSTALFSRPLDFDLSQNSGKVKATGKLYLFLFIVLFTISIKTHYLLSVSIIIASLLLWLAKSIRKQLFRMGTPGKYFLKAIQISVFAFGFGAMINYPNQVKKDEDAQLNQAVNEIVSSAESLIEKGDVDSALVELEKVPGLVDNPSAHSSYIELKKGIVLYKDEAKLKELIQQLPRTHFESLLKNEYKEFLTANASLNYQIILKMNKLAPTLKKAHLKHLKERELIARSEIIATAKKKQDVDKAAKLKTTRESMFGPAPTASGWDGSYKVIEKFLKTTAHDPDSIEFAGCTEVKVDDKKGWLIGCDYRGTNAFGGKVKNSHWFLIKHGKVVDRLPAGAYK